LTKEEISVARKLKSKPLSTVVRRLSFFSYVKLFFLSGLGFGVILSVSFLIAGLTGGRVTANIGQYYFTGTAAGVIGFFISPIVGGLGFAWFGLVLYWPFRLVMRVLWKVTFIAFTEDGT